MSVRHLAVLVTVAVAAGCGGGRESASGGQEGQAVQGGSVIRVDGSSTVFPITEAVAEEFQKEHQGTRVTVGISGTGGGFQKFCRGEIDVADASRPIRPQEVDACQKADIEFIELPVAYDGIAIVVNPKNTWASSITVAELKKLWSPEARGNIMRWSDVRAGWPEREIHLFGPGTDSGTFDYFTEVVAGKPGASRSDFTSSEDDNVLVQGVATDELALGYFGFAYYEENHSKLKVVPVDTGKGAVTPSPDTIRTGQYTPLSRPVFIYPHTASLSRPEVRSFIEFYLQNGGGLAREVGYVPLSDREYQLVSQRFAARKTGTLFSSGHSSKTLEATLAEAQ